MFSGSESAPQQRPAQRPVQPYRPDSRLGARALFAAMAVAGALSLGFGIAGCGGGGGGGNGNTTPTPTPSTAGPATVTGIIYDNYSQKGVAGATVRLGGQTATTAAGGSFTLSFTGGVAAGTLTVAAPSGSKGFVNALYFNGTCTPSLSLSVPAVAAGQTDNLGTLSVYDYDNEGQLPPPAACLNGV